MTSIFLTTMASAAGSSGSAAFFIQILPLLFVFVIFYMLMIRPQQRRMKEHQATIAAVKKGDEVVTAGGVRGKVTKVSDTKSGRDCPGSRSDRQVDAEHVLARFQAATTGLPQACLISLAGSLAICC